MFDLKKLFCITICLMVAGTAFAAEFAPTVMDISVPEQILYEFDGSEIDIDLTIDGVGGVFWLIINTKGKADNVNMVQNGFLGWHTVNKVDTTVYISSQFTRTAGTSTVTWDGKDNDGNNVVGDEYDYYVYGYDNANPRIPACMFMQAGAGWRVHNTRVVEYNEDGTPMSNPWLTSTNEPTGGYSYLGDAGVHGAHTRWPLGGDPEDLNNMQWTLCSIYTPYEDRSNDNYIMTNASADDPNDHSIFYQCANDVPGARGTVVKWAFVNNGNAVLDENGVAGITSSLKKICLSASGLSRWLFWPPRNIFMSVTVSRPVLQQMRTKTGSTATTMKAKKYGARTLRNTSCRMIRPRLKQRTAVSSR
jgi:hypothetical protein